MPPKKECQTPDGRSRVSGPFLRTVGESVTTKYGQSYVKVSQGIGNDMSGTFAINDKRCFNQTARGTRALNITGCISVVTRNREEIYRRTSEEKTRKKTKTPVRNLRRANSEPNDKYCEYNGSKINRNRNVR